MLFSESSLEGSIKGKVLSVLRYCTVSEVVPYRPTIRHLDWERGRECQTAKTLLK